MGDPGTGLGITRNRITRNRLGLRDRGLGLGAGFPGGQGDGNFPGKAAGTKRCFRAGRIFRTALLFGPGVGNVQDALTIGKTFDVTGVGNVEKLYQPQKDYEALSPAHIVTHTS
jgi:hypothetical protein